MQVSFIMQQQRQVEFGADGFEVRGVTIPITKRHQNIIRLFAIQQLTLDRAQNAPRLLGRAWHLVELDGGAAGCRWLVAEDALAELR